MHVPRRRKRQGGLGQAQGWAAPSSSPLYWKWMWSTMSRPGLATMRKNTAVPAAAGMRLREPCELARLEPVRWRTAAGRAGVLPGRQAAAEGPHGAKPAVQLLCRTDGLT